METDNFFDIKLTAKEMRYLVSCGIALIQNIPEEAIPTYTNFSKSEIISFSKRIRLIMDYYGLDM